MPPPESVVRTVACVWPYGYTLYDLYHVQFHACYHSWNGSFMCAGTTSRSPNSFAGNRRDRDVVVMMCCIAHAMRTCVSVSFSYVPERLHLCGFLLLSLRYCEIAIFETNCSILNQSLRQGYSISTTEARDTPQSQRQHRFSGPAWLLSCTQNL